MEDSSGNNSWVATKKKFASIVGRMPNAFEGYGKIRDKVSLQEMGKLMPDGMRNIGIRKSEQSRQGTNVADSGVNDADSVKNIRGSLAENPSNMSANSICGGMVEIDLGCSDSFVLCDGLIGDAEEGQQSEIGGVTSSPSVEAGEVSSERKKRDYSAVYSYYDQKNASAVSSRRTHVVDDAVKQRFPGMSGWLPDVVKERMEAVDSKSKREWLSSTLKEYRGIMRNNVPFGVRKLIPEKIRNTVDNIIKTGEQSRRERYVQMFNISDSGANSYDSPAEGGTSSCFTTNLNDTSAASLGGAVDTVSGKQIDYSAMYSHYAQKDAVAVSDKVTHAAGKKSGYKSKAKRKLDHAHSPLIYRAIDVKTSLKRGIKAKKSAANRKKSFFGNAVLEIEKKYLVRTGDSVGSNIIKDIGIDGKIINLTVDGGVKLKVEAMLESKFFKKNNISAVKFVLPEREVIIERISDGVLNYVVTKGSFTLMSKGKSVDARVVVYANPQGEGNIIRVSDVEQVGRDLGDRISKILVGGVFLWILLRYSRWTQEPSGMYVASTAGCVAPSSNLIDVSLPSVKQPSCVIKGGGESPSMGL